MILFQSDSQFSFIYTYFGQLFTFTLEGIEKTLAHFCFAEPYLLHSVGCLQLQITHLPHQILAHLQVQPRTCCVSTPSISFPILRAQFLFIFQEIGLLICNLFVAFFIIASFVGCFRSLSETFHHKTDLDVVEVFQKTKNVFSFKTTKKPTLHQTLSLAYSLFSFQIHLRVFINKSSHLDYKSLTLSRLGLDSTRVSSDITRLDMVVNSISKSDLKLLDNGLLFRVKDIKNPFLSGTSQGRGKYFSRVRIGKLTNQFYMVADTGSDIN